MENQTENFAASTEQPYRLGDTLRAAREARGLSVADVVHQIKYAPRQIEALEAEEFAHLPEPAFLRGFVRSYARLLQIDAAPLLAALPQAEISVPPVLNASVEAPFPNAQSVTRKFNLIWLAAALLVAALLATLSWWSRLPTPVAQPAQTVAPVLVQPVALPEPVSSVAQSAVLPATPVSAVSTSAVAVPNNSLRLVFDEDSWAEVKDASGKSLLAQRNPRGSEQHLSGLAPYTVVIGHAKGVRVFYQDKAVDLVPHTIVDVVRLTLE